MIKNKNDLLEIKNKHAETVNQRKSGTYAGKRSVMVCGETGCISSGCKEVFDTFKHQIEKESLSDKIELVRTGCFGICELGPVAVIYPDNVLYTRLDKQKAIQVTKEHLLKDKVITEYLYQDTKTGKHHLTIDSIPFYKNQNFLTREFSGKIDPEKIEEYIAVGGYFSLEKILSSMSGVDVIEQVKKSGLRGRGGGGFPTGLKWEFAIRETGDKYIICNADEGDPGAFMDRSQLEGNPHTVIEGMIIAGYAIGANTGYIYCRAEYPLAIERLETAINQAQQAGLLGENILGSSFSFEIEIRMGAGAFVCGEETALINSIEGKRGEARPKPPFPAKAGVWGKPTVVNNVETFANIPSLFRYGADYYSSLGTEKSKGTKVFALAGAVKNVGLIEVPMGIKLGNVIYDIGGGILDDKEFKAVQIGGPSGGCLSKEMLNTPIDYESLKQAGAMMGSGGLIVMNEDTCMVDLAKYFMEFVQEESCGKCPPCRIGTKRMLDILNRISEGKGELEDIDELIRLGEDISATAICGLGQTAPNPVLSTLKNFRAEYEAHIVEKHCEAGVCPDLVYAPCQNACPAGVNIPAFVSLTSVKRYDEALAAHIDRNPFPVACGMTCTHPCETKCRRQTLDAPLAIREIKRFMAEKGGKAGKYPMPPVMTRPQNEIKKIAIIGGGPSGLTAAFFLRRLGHTVTIYEAQKKLGGMMRYGIPEYRYPKAILDNEIQNILDMGITVKCNTSVGSDIDLESIKKNNDAVVVAIGGWQNKEIGLPGEDAKGVISGKDFLWLIAHNSLKSLKGKVIVVGGGNTAVDVARSALRLGAKEIILAYRRTIDQMPAEPEEIDELIEEGIHPTELQNIEEIIVKNGQVKGIVCRKQELGDFDRSGRKRPTPLDGETNKVIYKCDYLIPAISQGIDLSFAPDLKKNANGTLKIDKDTFVTSDSKIYGSGDVVEISNLAVAIGHGEKVAVSIEKNLNPGIIKKFSWRIPVSPDVFFDADKEPVETPRVDVEYSPVEERIKNFLIVNRGVNWEEKILAESGRCLRCDYRQPEITADTEEAR